MEKVFSVECHSHHALGCSPKSDQALLLGWGMILLQCFCIDPSSNIPCSCLQPKSMQKVKLSGGIFNFHSSLFFHSFSKTSEEVDGYVFTNLFSVSLTTSV